MKKNSSLVINQSAPLCKQDSESKTYGCRHTNPDICSSNSLDSICAFVREDKICQKPPRSWGKVFEKLKNRGEDL